jgi:hypothetical protein
MYPERLGLLVDDPSSRSLQPSLLPVGTGSSVLKSSSIRGPESTMDKDMSDGGTPSTYPLVIYARRGDVVLAVAGTVLVGLLMLGVAVFNWTDERGFRLLSGVSAPLLFYAGFVMGRSRRHPCLQLDREAVTFRSSYVWGAWWRPPKLWSREMTVRWSDLRRILIVQTRWPSGWGWIEFYVRPGSPGVAPPRKRRDEWPAFALSRHALDFPEASLEQVVARLGGPPVERSRSSGRQWTRG